jgi:hypothetical protein
MTAMRNAYFVIDGNPQRKKHLERCADMWRGNIVRQRDVTSCPGFIWLRVQFGTQ